MAICTVDYAEVFRYVDAQRTTRELSWRQVAAEVDVPPGTFTRLRKGLGVSDDTFVSLMFWLKADTSIQPFLKTRGQRLEPLQETPDPEV